MGGSGGGHVRASSALIAADLDVEDLPSAGIRLISDPALVLEKFRVGGERAVASFSCWGLTETVVEASASLVVSKDTQPRPGVSDGTYLWKDCIVRGLGDPGAPESHRDAEAQELVRTHSGEINPKELVDSTLSSCLSSFLATI